MLTKGVLVTLFKAFTALKYDDINYRDSYIHQKFTPWPQQVIVNPVKIPDMIYWVQI